MKRLFKGLFKLIVIVIVLLVIFVIFVMRNDKPKIRYEEPKITEKQIEPKPVEEEIPQEITKEVEEPKQEEIKEEPKEETINTNGIRPEFQKSMESYEAFFDEYVEFMNAFKKDSSNLSMLAQYAEFMSKYEQAMLELDSIDESKLTDAENRLFLDTQLRINNKLTQAAIDY